MTKNRQPNRLIHEASPYLQQHAHNPVDWYPWGAEALQKAKAEDKPIFLSVGYSACHWCHVRDDILSNAQCYKGSSLPDLGSEFTEVGRRWLSVAPLLIGT